MSFNASAIGSYSEAALTGWEMMKPLPARCWSLAAGGGSLCVFMAGRDGLGLKKNDSQICRRVRNYTLNAFLNETYISSFSGEKALVEHTGTVNAITKKLNQSIDSLLKSAGSLHGQYWYRALCLSWIVNGFFSYFSRATFTLPVKDFKICPGF